MTNLEEQHTGIKFCFRLGNTATEAFEMLKLAFRDKTVSRTLNI
jgi:hypothetical protein